MNIQTLLAWLIVAVLVASGGIWVANWLTRPYKPNRDRYNGGWMD